MGLSIAVRGFRWGRVADDTPNTGWDRWQSDSGETPETDPLGERPVVSSLVKWELLPGIC